MLDLFAQVAADLLHARRRGCRLFHARRHLFCHGGHVLRFVVHRVDHRFEFADGGVCLLGFLVHLLHEALHLHQSLDDDADLIGAVRQRGRNLAVQVARRDGIEVVDRGIQGRRDVVRDDARHDDAENQADENDRGEDLQRACILDVVRLEELLALEHVVRRQNLHVGADRRQGGELIVRFCLVLGCCAECADGLDRGVRCIEILVERGERFLRAIALLHLLDFFHIVPDAREVARDVIEEDLTILLREVLLHDVRYVDVDAAQSVVRVVQILRRHQVVVIHLVERLLCRMARIDADDGDECHGEEEEDGKDRNLRLYAVILQDLAAQSKIAHISQPPLTSRTARHFRA